MKISFLEVINMSVIWVITGYNWLYWINLKLLWKRYYGIRGFYVLIENWNSVIFHVEIAEDVDKYSTGLL